MRTCPYCAENIQDEAVRCRWCGAHVDPNRPPSVTGRRDNSRLAARIGLVVGGVLLAVAPLLPWADALVAQISLVRAASLASHFGALPHGDFFPIALIALGVIAVLTALVLRRRRALRIAAIIGGVEAVVLTLVPLLIVIAAADQTHGLVGIAIGPWVALAGAVVLLGGALVPAPTTDVATPDAQPWERSAAIGLAVLAAIPAALFAVASTELAQSSARTPLPLAAANPLGAPAAPTTSIAPPIEPVSPAAPTTDQIPPSETSAANGGGSAQNNAENLVRSKGYTPATTTNWPSPNGLNVVLGTFTQSADGYNQLAFFFLDGRYLGQDTRDPSAGISEAWSSGDTIALNYARYLPNDPNCCPSGGASLVRYHWNGSALIPLDPVPPTTDSPAGSRR